MVARWVLALTMAASGVAGAETYYVAPSGKDTNPGTKDAPFAHIQKAADVLQPGDECAVVAGAYRETVRPARSGEPDKPIVFRAEDGTAVVSGADPITGWEAGGNGHYKARTEPGVRQTFADGKMLYEARWPNAKDDPVDIAWAEAGPGTGAEGIVDPKLPDVDLAGATVMVLPGRRWVSWTRPVKGVDAATKTVRFDVNWGQDEAYKLQEGSRYYVFGAASLLDAPGEWFQDSAGMMTLYPPSGVDPNKARVEVKRRDWAFDLSGLKHVRVEGFRIFAASINMADAERCTVDRCHIRYASHFTQADGWGVPDSGVVISGHDNVFKDSSVVYSAGNGITLKGENNTVDNCLVRDVDYMALDCGAVWMEGRKNAVVRCTLSDAGRSLILHRTLKAGRIEDNDISHAGRLTTDLGATYCFQTDGEGTVIAHNWVHDNLAEHVGVGIYIDNGSSNFLIHHNISWNNPDSGIRLNTPSYNNRVYHNTVVNNGNSLSYWGPGDEKRQPGCEAVDNIFTNEVRLGDGIRADHNFDGPDPGFVSVKDGDFRLRDGSPCIDAGVVIEGISGAVEGKAPDLGAYEHGLPAWKPGHNWGVPPEF